MTRSVLFLLVAVVCFVVAGIDAGTSFGVLTPLAFTEFGVAAFVAAKVPSPTSPAA